MPYRNKTPEQIRKAISESKIGEPRVEIVRSPQAITEDVQTMIARIVRERVDEIMVKVEAGQVAPDFLSNDEAAELRRRQDMFDQHKWSLYFQKWGCRMCHRKNVSHRGTGHCNTCHTLIAQRLKGLRVEWEREHPDEIDRQIDRLTSRFRVAKSLLNRGEE